MKKKNMTEAAQKSLELLRDPTTFGWWVVPLFVLAIYVYAVEIERRNWGIILAGLAFWGMDWFNEIWNGLVLKATGVSALWTTPGGSAFIIFTGLNLEISLMFAILGIVCIKMLPPDKGLKILGIPNRIFFMILNSVLCVIVEIFLNWAGALVWHYWWWNWFFPFPIILVGYMPFMAAAFWVYDMDKLKHKLMAVGTIFAVDALGILVFGVILRWI
jgi:hypothetical protein